MGIRNVTRILIVVAVLLFLCVNAIADTRTVPATDLITGEEIEIEIEVAANDEELYQAKPMTADQLLEIKMNALKTAPVQQQAICISIMIANFVREGDRVIIQDVLDYLSNIGCGEFCLDSESGEEYAQSAILITHDYYDVYDYSEMSMKEPEILYASEAYEFCSIRLFDTMWVLLRAETQTEGVLEKNKAGESLLDLESLPIVSVEVGVNIKDPENNIRDLEESILLPASE